jgi:hypothetical protein
MAPTQRAPLPTLTLQPRLPVLPDRNLGGEGIDRVLERGVLVPLASHGYFEARWLGSRVES